MDFSKSLQIKSKIRHNEYYNLINIFDKLYQDSCNNKKFNNLMDLITSNENILLASRNIKKNTSSNTSGTDNKTIKDIEMLFQDKYIYYVKKKFKNYIPKAVRRIEISKHLGGTDKHENLIILHENIHKLIHDKDKNTINHYLEEYSLSKEQIDKVNKFRNQAGLQPI